MARHAGTHTTLIDLAKPICEGIHRLSGVDGVSPGFIVAGTKMNHTQRVKIAEGDGCVMLTFRSARTVQEVRVYSTDHQATKLAIARLIRDQKVAICFAEADKKRIGKRKRHKKQ
ncbi:MAG: DUF2103 domain-containing protein [Patescibacteria group bacterium]